MSSQPQNNADEFDDAMGVNDVDPSTGLSRRSMRKRGAVVGVAAAWSVPMVSGGHPRCESGDQVRGRVASTRPLNEPRLAATSHG
jgi:hypothetical protein